MIIDFHKDPNHAIDFDVLDLDTGLLPANPETGCPLGIFYADDEAGIYRFHKTDARGLAYLSPDKREAAWGEVKGARIKIISREEGQRLREMMPSRRR